MNGTKTSQPACCVLPPSGQQSHTEPAHKRNSKPSPSGTGSKAAAGRLAGFCAICSGAWKNLRPVSKVTQSPHMRGTASPAQAGLAQKLQQAGWPVFVPFVQEHGKRLSQVCHSSCSLMAMSDMPKSEAVKNWVQLAHVPHQHCLFLCAKTFDLWLRSLACQGPLSMIVSRRRQCW